MISRRHLIQGALAGVFAGFGTSAQALVPGETVVGPRPRTRPGTPGASAPAVPDLAQVIRDFDLRGQSICAVADAQTGHLIEDYRGDQTLPPASVAKAITALYALEVLGRDYRFSTQVFGTGAVVSGVLQGDLILAGGGDPTLTTDDLAALVTQLRSAGIQKVQGNFVVWENALPYIASIDPGQPDHVGYSPAISGLALNFNRVHFEWKRAGAGWSTTLQARTERRRPDVGMTKMKIVDRSHPVFSYLNERQVDSWSVAKAALGNAGARWLPVRRPALYTADVFRTLLRSQGIAVGNPTFVRHLPQATVLARHDSEALPELLQAMLKYSNNLMAEMIGMRASVQQGAKFTTLAGSAAQMNAWVAQKYGMTRTRLVDHSGLGEASRVSAKDLLRALITANRDKRLRPLLKPVVIKDRQGRPIYDHPMTVDAKTGTLNFVSGLGGYITTPQGRELAFAIFSADLDRRANIPRAKRERPPGARSWNARAKSLQQVLLVKWGSDFKK